jgi:hypothetical protein
LCSLFVPTPLLVKRTRRARLGPSAAVLARWERGRAKYPAILLAPIHPSAWKVNSQKFALAAQTRT